MPLEGRLQIPFVLVLIYDYLTFSYSVQFSSVQSFSRVQLFVTP